MTTEPIVIIGAGGHATVVADVLLACGARVLGYTDADVSLHGSTLCGLRVLGGDDVLKTLSPSSVRLANGIGGTRGEALRSTIQRQLEKSGWSFVQIRHPSAIVSPHARIDDGVHLMAGSVVQPNARIGRGCIVNTAAVVEHDVELGEYVHVAPRALLCGAVTVGEMSHVGAGAVVRQGLRLGPGTVIGAGAVLVEHAPTAAVWVGTPARPLEARR